MPFLTIFWAAVILIAIIGGIFTMRYFRRRYRQRMKSPPTSDTYNTTNYNMMSEDPNELADLSVEEARNLMKKWKESGHIPSHRDFYQVQRILEEGGNEEDKQ